MNPKYRILLSISLMLTATIFSGCAISSDGSGKVVKECILPADQSATLSGHWQATPIPVAFHSGDFSATEVAAITAAADSWNSFSKASLGITLINYGDKSNPNTSAAPKPTGTCTTGIVQGTQFTGQVVIYKQAQWPYANLADAIALTSYCPIPAKPLNNFYMAFMEVNYQNFFVAGRKLPDLQTIATHEFGHLAGLNHSCEKATKSGVPNCTDPNLPDAYFSAVMFPIFSFDQAGYGEQKRVLLDNDQGRANCLYKSGS